MKTFVINLNRRKDRLKEFASSVTFDYERFSATDGKIAFPDSKPRLQGHLGCWDSHRRLLNWSQFSEFPMVMVLEDDVELAPEFEQKLEIIMKELPEDWDLLYLGGWNTEERKPYSEHLDIAERVLTTHAYIIRDKFIPKLIETLNGRRFKVDVVFCDALSKGKCFIAHPVIAWQREGFSDITNSVNTNEHLKI